MGTYFNPNNESFASDKRSKIYVDKTGLINYLNDVIGTSTRCLAVSHARRFGKSHAAGMIDAYYSLGSDSKELFADTKIAKSSNFEKYLNQYNVIHLDIASVANFHKEDLVEECIRRITEDITEALGSEFDTARSIELLLNKVYEKTGKTFVIIIDEWDCVVRNHADAPELVHRYLQFLHSLFKSEESKRFLALGYITGILPIKKIQDESALNNFREFTMLKSRPITEYYGFTESEVKTLCEQYQMDFETTKAWYDGYLLDGTHMYNPNSVVQAMMNRDVDSYWRNTSSFSSINTFINLNYEGLKDDVLSMLAGGRVLVDTQGFQNDMTMVASKDDALTALIHLGYLAYDYEAGEAYIPNYEVLVAFQQAIKSGEWKEIARSISRCDELLRDTINGNEERVAELIELAHETYTSVLKYNDENSLSCVLTMAYFTAPAYYEIIRECPAGKGYADFIFIPRANAGSRPAMVVELKYNKSVDTALNQIKEKRYTGRLSEYKGKVLLVGISYETDGANAKKHTCKIETIE